MKSSDKNVLQFVKREAQKRYRQNIEILKSETLTENERILLEAEKKLLRKQIAELQKIAA